MSATGDTVGVRDEPANSRFVVEEGDDVAELVYDLDGDRLFLLHTGVPDAFQHRGIGGDLVMAAVDRARAERLTIVPWCPFARRWLREHPDVAGTVTIDWKTPRP
jgi:predicted GNAT family acetyltransferase